jgi:hypothetical protein
VTLASLLIFFHESICNSNSPGTESECYVTTDVRSSSLSWNKAPIWGLRPEFYYCQTVVGLLMWGALPDERTGLSFTIVAGPRQRSHSRVRVPWDSRFYFTLSDSRLPILSPPTTRRATVEVFDPASTRDRPRTFRYTSYIPSARIVRKHCLQRFFYCCASIRSCDTFLFSRYHATDNIMSQYTHAYCVRSFEHSYGKQLKVCPINSV